MESSCMDVVYGHVGHLPPSTLKHARWKTMSGLELSGFINVKIPSRERKFSSWKAWKRQWCVISRNGNIVSLQIGSDKGNPLFAVQIPEDAILCRTESRSKFYAFGIFRTDKKHKEGYLYLSGESETDTQKWMSNIRRLLKPPLQSPAENEFEISLIDNSHSREAGLMGLYGYLSVNSSEIVIKDPHTTKIKVTWHWSQISHSSLPLPSNPEDVHRVCLINTSSKFKTSEGELEIFCIEADKLHEKLSVCPRFSDVPRIVTQPLPPTPESTPPPTPPRLRVNTSASSLSAPQMLVSSRRMSRSENDLQKFFLQRSLNSIRQNGSQELILLSHENITNANKVPSLIFANIGLLISTPGCSEPGSLNDIRVSENNQHIETFHHTNKYFQEKIEYEMIDEEEVDQVEEICKKKERKKYYRKQDSTSSIISGDYEEIFLRDGEFENEYKSIAETPPPLPPRKSNRSLFSPSDEKEKTPAFKSSQEYLPMSPNKHIDPKYMVMANLKEKILVSEPIPI